MPSYNNKYMSEEYDSEDFFNREENEYDSESSFCEDNDLTALNRYEPSGEWREVDENSSLTITSRTSIPDSWEDDEWETAPASISFYTQVFKPALPTKTAQPILSDEEIRMEAQRMAHLKRMEEDKKMREIRASLPTESAAGRAKRLKAEKEMLASKNKPRHTSGNVFGHRRNGGGKGKKDLSAAPTAKALEEIAAAKLQKKRMKKAEKKAEEEKRAVAFKNSAQADKPVEVPVVMADLGEEEEEEEVYDISAVMTKTMDIDYGVNQEKRQMVKATPFRKGKGNTKTFIVGSSRISELRGHSFAKSKKMCRYVAEGKACPHGDKCRFAHTKEDVITAPLSERDQGFEMFSNKDKMADKLKFTKMCKSVSTGKPCLYPEGKCRFAHSIEQLQIADCGFGDQCRRVSWSTSGVCRNKSKTVKCDFKHPSETKENFYSRTGLKRVASEKKPERSIVVRPVVKTTPIITEEQKATPNAWAALLKPQVAEPVAVETKPRKSPSLWDVKPQVAEPVAVEEEMVLKVPKSLEMMALEMAMKSGKTNIRIEIVD